MKLLIPTLLVLGMMCNANAQTINNLIKQADVQRIEAVLSSNKMEGRGNFTPGLEKAAHFISAAFEAAGLYPWGSNQSFRQPFSIIVTKPLSVSAIVDGRTLSSGEVQVISSSPSLSVTQNNGYSMVFIKAGDSFMKKASGYIHSDVNYFVVVDTSFASSFSRLARFSTQQFKSPHQVLFVLSSEIPSTYEINFKQEVTESMLTNIVGVLPGTTKKNEYVIFSAHYDHLGIGRPNAQGDSIYNGANDDASGTTAVITLAKYFSTIKGNERTIIFAAFAGEEIGGYGSQYFSRQFDPALIVAMINIEMIGTDSKWGLNSAYITGYEKSDLGKILDKNLAKSHFKFYPDPYPSQQLFYRSDNATLARLGVPAHTVSTSKMDSEKYYHTVGDEIGTLNLRNMTEIIKAIAISATSIIAGKDTPSRVDTEQLGMR